MAEQIGPRTAIVSSKELGTNCWLPRRFVQEGPRCDRVWTCSYPEKKTCQAVKAEIQYLMAEQKRLRIIHKNLYQRIDELQKMLEK